MSHDFFIFFYSVLISSPTNLFFTYMILFNAMKTKWLEGWNCPNVRCLLQETGRVAIASTKTSKRTKNVKHIRSLWAHQCPDQDQRGRQEGLSRSLAKTSQAGPAGHETPVCGFSHIAGRQIATPPLRRRPRSLPFPCDRRHHPVWAAGGGSTQPRWPRHVGAASSPPSHQPHVQHSAIAAWTRTHRHPPASQR